MKTIIIMGSTSDEPHAKKITDKLDEYGITWEQHAASAHKQPLKVLDILTANSSVLFSEDKSIISLLVAIGIRFERTFYSNANIVRLFFG